MKKLRGSQQASELQDTILDLITAFDERLTKSRFSRHLIDAHVAAILINLLHLIVAERKTFYADDLAKIVKETLQESQYYEH